MAGIIRFETQGSVNEERRPKAKFTLAFDEHRRQKGEARHPAIPANMLMFKKIEF